MRYSLDQPPLDAMQILERIERSELSVEQALQLIQGAAPEGEHQPSVETHTKIHPLPKGFEKWKNWWFLPFWIGFGLTLTGAVLAYLAIQTYGIGFWFFCAGLFSILGFIILALAWLCRKSPWLHMRINNLSEFNRRRFALSFPLPMKPVIFLLRLFSAIIPDLRKNPFAQMLQAWANTSTYAEPLYFQLDGGRERINIEIYIG